MLTFTCARCSRKILPAGGRICVHCARESPIQSASGDSIHQEQPSSKTSRYTVAAGRSGSDSIRLEHPSTETSRYSVAPGSDSIRRKQPSSKTSRYTVAAGASGSGSIRREQPSTETSRYSVAPGSDSIRRKQPSTESSRYSVAPGSDSIRRKQPSTELSRYTVAAGASGSGIIRREQPSTETSRYSVAPGSDSIRRKQRSTEPLRYTVAAGAAGSGSIRREQPSTETSRYSVAPGSDSIRRKQPSTESSRYSVAPGSDSIRRKQPSTETSIYRVAAGRSGNDSISLEQPSTETSRYSFAAGRSGSDSIRLEQPSTETSRYNVAPGSDSIRRKQPSTETSIYRVAAGRSGSGDSVCWVQPSSETSRYVDVAGGSGSDDSVCWVQPSSKTSRYIDVAGGSGSDDSVCWVPPSSETSRDIDVAGGSGNGDSIRWEQSSSKTSRYTDVAGEPGSDLAPSDRQTSSILQSNINNQKESKDRMFTKSDKVPKRSTSIIPVRKPQSLQRARESVIHFVRGGRIRRDQPSSETSRYTDVAGESGSGDSIRWEQSSSKTSRYTDVAAGPGSNLAPSDRQTSSILQSNINNQKESKDRMFTKSDKVPKRSTSIIPVRKPQPLQRARESVIHFVRGSIHRDQPSSETSRYTDVAGGSGSDIAPSDTQTSSNAQSNINKKNDQIFTKSDKVPKRSKQEIVGQRGKGFPDDIRHEPLNTNQNATSDFSILRSLLSSDQPIVYLGTTQRKSRFSKCDKLAVPGPSGLQRNEDLTEMSNEVSPQSKAFAYEKTFICSVCNDSISNHAQPGEKRYKCCVCMYKTFMQANLETHSRIHTPKKLRKEYTVGDSPKEEHICMVCNKKFQSKTQLEDHYLDHRVYFIKNCWGCGDELNNHVTTSDGKKIFVCCVCGFRHGYNLKSHNKSHQPKFLCKICKEEYDAETKTLHDGKFECVECKERFRCQTQLEDHLFEDHKIFLASNCVICKKKNN